MEEKKPRNVPHAMLLFPATLEKKLCNVKCLEYHACESVQKPLAIICCSRSSWFTWSKKELRRYVEVGCLRHAGASTILIFLPRDQILLRNWHPQQWWTSVQSADTCSSSKKVAVSEYYAGLTGPANTRYHKKVSTCGVDPYMLKKSDGARIQRTIWCHRSLGSQESN